METSTVTRPCALCGRTLGLLWNDRMCQDCEEWDAWARSVAAQEARGDEINETREIPRHAPPGANWLRWAQDKRYRDEIIRQDDQRAEREALS